MHVSKIVICAILAIVGLMLFSSMGIMASPPAVPTAKPVSGGGSGGGGGGGSYNPPSFVPYTIDLKSTDGSVIGTVVGKSFYLAGLKAEKTATIDNRSYALTMEAELGGKPADDARLDITFLAPDDAGMPKGMTGVHILGLLSIQKISTWNLKADTVNLTLTVPGTPSGGPEAVYYLVSDDGGSYRILNATLRDASAGTMTFVVSPKADSGLFTLVEAGASAPMATAEPMPTAAAPRIAEMSVSSASLLPAIDPAQFAGILGAAVVLFGAALFVIYSATRR